MGLINKFTSRVLGKNASTDATDKIKDATLRRCKFEVLEQRRVLSADPVIAGVTYLEGDVGQDTTPDYFEVSFEGGSETTELASFTINGDQDNSGGLSDGDMFFDVNDELPGTGGFHDFQFDATQSIGVSESDITGFSVSSDGLLLSVDVQNFEAGDVLAFTIDVDEVERLRVDKIASGVEFEASLFNATFVDPHFTFAEKEISLTANLEGGFNQPQSEGIFYDEYDQLFVVGSDTAGTDLNLSADNAEGSSDRTAGAIDAFDLVEKPITIAGTVYHDEDLDCIHDEGEDGIAGVTIELQKLNEDTGEYEALHRTLTDASGNYEFGLDLDLKPGEYRLVETQPDGYLDVGASAGTVDGTETGVVSDDASGNANVIGNISIPNGGTAATDYDFKEVRPASIAGNVWHDLNNDGVFDPNEEGIANVLIQVTRVGAKPGVAEDPFAGSEPIFVRTDANGHYSVDQLPPGIYEVVEINNYPEGNDPLASFIDGKDSVGNVAGTPNGTGANDRVTQIELCADDAGVEYNFGEIRAASIGGYVSVDTPGGNKLSPDDPDFEPISGVTIQLLSETGELLAETLTDETGHYEFGDLLPGTYSVIEVQPDGYLDGGDVIGNIDGVNTGTVSNDRFDGITVSSGDVGQNYDFCEHDPASIKGTVYHDRNDNGIQDAGEEGIGGVVIELFDGDGVLVSSTTTDANGDYCFEDLLAGEYKIRETQPTAFNDGKDTLGVINGADGRTTESGHVADDEFCDIILTGGDDGVEFNFGELRPASISGTVHADANGDCVFNPADGDEPLAGVRLVLLNEAGEVVGRTVTDENGDYSFDDLPPGTYSVRETTPEGFVDGDESVGTIAGETIGSALDDILSGIVLSSGDSAVNYDFCEHIPAQLKGTVYHDRNDNGVQDDGEEGIGGVVIELFDTDGNLVASTTTDAAGDYCFEDLIAGTYKIRETQPTAFTDGKDTLGHVDGTPVGEAGNDEFCDVVIGGGETGEEFNFGELKLAEISGFVHVDVNGDCIFDASVGDSPLSNVTMELLNADGDVIATTLTGSDGSYSFGGLVPGTYSVRQIQPDSYFTGGEQVGDGGGAQSENLLSNIIVDSGQKVTQYNFCEHEAAEIHGRVWEDGPAFETDDGTVPEGYRNLRDGVYQEGTDTPIEGVRMELYYYIDPTNNQLEPRPVTLGEVMSEFYGHMGTTDPDAPVFINTNSEGEYWFQGLQAGNYIVLQDQPDGFVDANDIPGTTSGVTFNEDGAVETAIAPLTRTFTATQLQDTVANIRLDGGGISLQNNFTEVRAFSTPVTPDTPLVPQGTPNTPTAPPNPVTPRPGITGLPGLFGSQPSAFTQFVGTSRGAQFQTRAEVATGEDPYTWHLSVVNGGLPRSASPEAADANSVWSQAGYMSSQDWNRFDMDDAVWTYTTTQEDTISKTAKTDFFGMVGGTPLAGDFDGDGIDEIGVYRNGYWLLDINHNGKWDENDLLAKLGDADDRPVVGDWDGDGKDDIGIYGPMWERDPEAIARDPGLPNPDNKPYTNPKNIPPVTDDATNGARVMKLTSYGKERADVVDHVFGTGDGEEIPVTGDWNGNGIRSIGTFRDGEWQMDVNGDGKFDFRDETAQFGRAGDRPLVGDFDGDGVEEIAVYRNGTWIMDTNGNRELDATDKTFEMGGAADKPVVGDFDGDGVDEPALYTQQTSQRQFN